MMPQLSTIGTSSGALAPPLRFRPLGNISQVTLQNRDYVRHEGQTEVQEIGLRYESQVQKVLKEMFPIYLAGPVITLLDDSVMRSLRPDGLLIHAYGVFIFEIKYQHCPEAWWQLEKLYKRASEKLFHRPISLVEVCRTYDPATPFPCEVTLVPDLNDWVSQPRPDHFGVHVWRKL